MITLDLFSLLCALAMILAALVVAYLQGLRSTNHLLDEEPLGICPPPGLPESRHLYIDRPLSRT